MRGNVAKRLRKQAKQLAYNYEKLKYQYVYNRVLRNSAFSLIYPEGSFQRVYKKLKRRYKNENKNK